MQIENNLDIKTMYVFFLIKQKSNIFCENFTNTSEMTTELKILVKYFV